MRNIGDCPRQVNFRFVALCETQGREHQTQPPASPSITIPRSHPTDRGELILCLPVWHLYSQDIFLLSRTNCWTGCFGRGSGQFETHSLWLWLLRADGLNWRWKSCNVIAAQFPVTLTCSEQIFSTKLGQLIFSSKYSHFAECLGEPYSFENN